VVPFGSVIRFYTAGPDRIRLDKLAGENAPLVCRVAQELARQESGGESYGAE
jgi:hypothetical protein